MSSNPKDTQGEKQSGTEKKSGRGFASMDRARQREIASQGGRAAHEKGTAHEFTSAEAREAGRKGGENSHGGRSQASRAASGANSTATRPSAQRSDGERSGQADDQSEGNRGRASAKNGRDDEESGLDEASPGMRPHNSDDSRVNDRDDI